MEHGSPLCNLPAEAAHHCFIKKRPVHINAAPTLFLTKQLEIKIFVLLLVVVVRILRAVRRLVLALVLLAAVFAVVVLIVVLVLVVILIVVLIGIRHFKSLLNVFSYNHIVSFFRNSIQKTGLKILGLLYHFYVEICFILCYINISR